MIGKALLAAGAIGSALQLVMVVTGHQVQPVQDWYGPGGMTLSLIAGVIYARMSGGGWSDVMVGGLVAGGACAFVGIGVSYLLGDVPGTLLLLGTAASAAAGAVGGVIGRLVG